MILKFLFLPFIVTGNLAGKLLKTTKYDELIEWSVNRGDYSKNITLFKGIYGPGIRTLNPITAGQNILTIPIKNIIDINTATEVKHN